MVDEKSFKSWLQKAEYPFIRPDMTQEEYLDELDYFFDHFDDVRKGTYKSLYEQKAYSSLSNK